MSAPTAKSRVGLKIGIAVLVLAAIALALYYSLRATATVVEAHRGPAVDVVTGSVVVHADKDLQELRSELPGRVFWVDPRQIGEPFKKGEPIVKLDSTDLERDIKQAENDYNLFIERLKIQKENDPALQVAKDNFANAERRLQFGEISEEELKAARRALDRVQTDLALAQFDAKQAKLKFDNDQEERRRRLEKMTIRAPMDGVAEGVRVAPGALIAQGTVVATFFSNERVVIAKVGEEDVGKVKVGQPAILRLLIFPDERFEAKVTMILPFADPDTQRYGVYLDVKADLQKLKPFSTGEVNITVGKHENQVLVPRRAIFNDSYLFVVKNGVVHKRRVTLGFRALNAAEVTENLAEGEQVIVNDVDQFRDGQYVGVKVAKWTSGGIATTDTQ